jgi:hypothetical protein
MFSLYYILVCAVIACLGIRRKFGFWGYFFASLLLTPLMGIILIAASDAKARNDEKYKS